MILSDPANQDIHPLTKTDAVYRASVISDVSYDVKLMLPVSDTYCGHIKITFKAINSLTKDLNIDFRGVSIANLKVNGNLVDVTFKKHLISLPSQSIKQGDNEVSSHSY